MFINQTETIGLILSAATLSLTGNIFLTLLMILIFLIVICITFQIPLEFISVILLPLCLAMGAYYTDFISIIIILLIYVSALIAKNWFFK